MSAMKYKTALLVAVLMLFVCGLTAGADSVFVKPENESWVTDTDGHIVLKGSLTIDAGTPVTVMAAPQILDGGTDVTAQRVEQAANAAAFLALVDYVETFTLGEDQKIELSFYLKDSFPTGNGVILLGYNGGEGLMNLGSFEHVGKDDVDKLVKGFNDGNAENYAGIIEADLKGPEVLRKISANTDGYSALTKKDEFAAVLYGLKPEGGFDAETLIQGFNEAVAWISLREADTLATLKLYNGQYWSLPLSEGDDFFTVPSGEQTKILSAVKNGGYTDKEKLLSDFLKNTALARFRTVADRDSLAALLGNAAYSEYFQAASAILAGSGLNEYYLAVAYNYVLEGNSSCTTIEAINTLFGGAVDYAESVQREENKSVSQGSGGVGGSRGPDVRLPESVSQGPVIETTPIPLPEEARHPFTDVPKGHWAEGYIVEMYEKGIISGITADSFDPAGEISRQDFVKIIVIALQLELSNAGHGFLDVEKGSYYEPYVVTAVENGLISGTSDDTFGLGTIKREDVAVILCRALEGKKAEGAAEAVAFTDAGDISDYAGEAVEKAAGYGLFGGDEAGRFNPKASLLRAEACALISRLLAATDV